MNKSIKYLCLTLFPCLLSGVMIKNFIIAPLSIKIFLITTIFITGMCIYPFLLKTTKEM